MSGTCNRWSVYTIDDVLEALADPSSEWNEEVAAWVRSHAPGSPMDLALERIRFLAKELQVTIYSMHAPLTAIARAREGDDSDEVALVDVLKWTPPPSASDR
jgi:hypothetical protein